MQTIALIVADEQLVFRRPGTVLVGTVVRRFRSANMTKAEQFRARAKACMELGRQAAEPEMRRQFLDLASQWETLAQAQEALSVGLSAGHDIHAPVVEPDQEELMAQQQKAWAEKDRQKLRAAHQREASADDARATDDEPADGKLAEKRREEMRRQDKAEGERRD